MTTRRGFIQGALAALVALVVPKTAKASSFKHIKGYGGTMQINGQDVTGAASRVSFVSSRTASDGDQRCYLGGCEISEGIAYLHDGA